MPNVSTLEKLLDAEALLKSTKRAYSPTGFGWRRGMPLLWDARTDLDGPNGKRLALAHGLLKQTEKGYDPRAPRWAAAMAHIDAVEEALATPPLPWLGPLVAGGKPLLLEQLTHNTDGVFDDTGSQYPALDFGWRAGVKVLAPEPMSVRLQSGSAGGDAFFALGRSGLDYWFGHLVVAPPTGKSFRAGDVIGTIAAIAGADHGHAGIDGRRLLGGRDFLYGGQRSYRDRPDDYTFGSPTVGQQLTRALAA